jgi:D-glycero-alpha-D-manno-heptose-7-phosphate kinase
MIIVRSPLRITLGGGGTDLPSYYREYSGLLFAAAIDKYVYITLHDVFEPRLILKYSQMETCTHVDEVEHPIIREALRMVGFEQPHLEITSMADIPAGTGLGSSGSFTVALLKALHVQRRNIVPPRDLAEQACTIEIDRLGEPIGKQDQYIAAYGGLTCFRFLPNDAVEAWPLQIDDETRYNLEDNLMLFFTGFSRSAGSILKEQDQKSRTCDRGMLAHLHQVKEFGRESRECLEAGDLRRFAELLDQHWQHKKQRAGNMTNGQIDAWYQLGRANGALGGKLVGAGGGGFLMFYAEDKVRLRQAMREAGLRELRFRFDTEGATVVAQS